MLQNSLVKIKGAEKSLQMHRIFLAASVTKLETSDARFKPVRDVIFTRWWKFEMRSKMRCSLAFLAETAWRHNPKARICRTKLKRQLKSTKCIYFLYSSVKVFLNCDILTFSVPKHRIHSNYTAFSAWEASLLPEISEYVLIGLYLTFSFIF